MTVHSISDTPGKAVVHMSIPDVQIGATSAQRGIHPSAGVEMIRESILTGHIVTDEDERLKFKG